MVTSVLTVSRSRLRRLLTMQYSRSLLTAMLGKDEASYGCRESLHSGMQWRPAGSAVERPRRMISPALIPKKSGSGKFAARMRFPPGSGLTERRLAIATEGLRALVAGRSCRRSP